MPDTIRRANYYYVTVPQRPGEGARILSAFSDAGVNFQAVHGFPEGGGAQIDLFPEDPEAFERAAEDAGIEVSDRKSGFLIRGEDRVGAVAGILGRLGDADVNVIALDAIATGGTFGALLWVEPEAMDRAAEALGA